MGKKHLFPPESLFWKCRIRNRLLIQTESHKNYTHPHQLETGFYFHIWGQDICFREIPGVLQTFYPVAIPLLLIRVSAQEPSALSAASPCNYIRVSQFSNVKLDFCPSVSITASSNPEGQVDILKNYTLFLTLSF